MAGLTGPTAPERLAPEFPHMLERARCEIETRSNMAFVQQVHGDRPKDQCMMRPAMGWAHTASRALATSASVICLKSW